MALARRSEGIAEEMVRSAICPLLLHPNMSA